MHTMRCCLKTDARHEARHRGVEHQQTRLSCSDQTSPKSRKVINMCRDLVQSCGSRFSDSEGNSILLFRANANHKVQGTTDLTPDNHPWGWNADYDRVQVRYVSLDHSRARNGMQCHCTQAAWTP